MNEKISFGKVREKYLKERRYSFDAVVCFFKKEVERKKDIPMYLLFPERNEVIVIGIRKKEDYSYFCEAVRQHIQPLLQETKRYFHISLTRDILMDGEPETLVIVEIKSDGTEHWAVFHYRLEGKKIVWRETEIQKYSDAHDCWNFFMEDSIREKMLQWSEQK